MLASRADYTRGIPACQVVSRNFVEIVWRVYYTVCMAYKGPPREWLESLGARITAARNAAALTQTQLAIKVKAKTGADITRAQIQQYEDGKSEPPSSKLDAIALTLGLEVSVLTGRKRVHPLEIVFQDDELTEADKTAAQDVALAELQRRKLERSINVR